MSQLARLKYDLTSGVGSRMQPPLVTVPFWHRPAIQASLKLLLQILYGVSYNISELNLLWLSGIELRTWQLSIT